ncbi:SMI1/KNR4 family protein [Oceanicola sp. D3]|uniref:SMI1/KNR4 family protein n=1 Tax=Oceanicola sp. D3 TaxID=2587163 RepID=UPI00143D0A64|nr:SMI1/KNR4 family protein [Oceanicola sp. D3]
MLAGRNWSKAGGASGTAIASLVETCKYPLPNDYLWFLRLSNGGDGPLSVDPLWLCIYSAESVEDYARSGLEEEHHPGLFVIGSNSGGEYIAFDFRDDGEGKLVYFDGVAGEESSEPLAESFSDLISLLEAEDSTP